MLFAAAAMVCCNNSSTTLGGDDEGDNPGGNNPGGDTEQPDTPGPGPGEDEDALSLLVIGTIDNLQSRAVVNAQGATWRVGDTITFIEVEGDNAPSVARADAKMLNATTVSGDLKTANFSTKVEDKGESQFRYLAVSPYNAVTEFHPADKTVDVNMPQAQTPSGLEVMSNSIVMVAASQSFELQPTSVRFGFKHVGAYGCMIIENLAGILKTNAKVSSVEIFSTEGKALAGSYTYNYDDPSQSAAIEGTNSVRLNVASQQYGPDSGGNLNVFFTTLPAKLEGYSVVVTAYSSTLNKENTYTYTTDNVLNLEAGTMTTFSIDMKGIMDDQLSEVQSFEKVATESALNQLVPYGYSTTAVGVDGFLITMEYDGETYLVGNTICAGTTKKELGNNTVNAPCVKCSENGITVEDGVITGPYMSKYTWKLKHIKDMTKDVYWWNMYDEEQVYLYFTLRAGGPLKLYQASMAWYTQFVNGAFQMYVPSYNEYLYITQDGSYVMRTGNGTVEGMSNKVTFYYRKK